MASSVIYKPRQVTVEAWQWDGTVDGARSIPDWVAPKPYWHWSIVKYLSSNGEDVLLLTRETEEEHGTWGVHREYMTSCGTWAVRQEFMDVEFINDYEFQMKYEPVEADLR